MEEKETEYWVIPKVNAVLMLVVTAGVSMMFGCLLTIVLLVAAGRLT